MTSSMPAWYTTRLPAPWTRARWLTPGAADCETRQAFSGLVDLAALCLLKPVFVYRVDFSETDLRARFLVGRQWDGYALITSTLFELAEASVVVATEVAVGVSPGRQVSESGAL